MSASVGSGDEVVILGGGLAGLATALGLQAGGVPWRILEAGDRPGGLARSETRDGYTFDATGHWLHLRDPQVKGLVDRLLGEDLVTVSRSAWIHTHGRYVPYPFQTHIGALPPEVAYECLQGFVDARGRADDAPAPRSFQEYVVRSLGEGIARHFMVPYNRKLWTVDLDELSLDWMDRFVPQPTVAEVLRGAVGAGDAAQGYNARFVYPREGGIELLPRRLAGALTGPLHLDTRVVGVSLAEGRVHTARGDTFPFRRLVSSLPLPHLVGLCADAPEPVRAAAAALRATEVTYVNVGVRVPSDAEPLPYQWVYFPEPEFPFYRAGCASAAVPGLAPPDGRTFYVEFSHRGPLDPARCEAEAVAGLRRAGLIRPEDEVRFAFSRRIPVAYVLFDHAHAAAREVILAWLSSQGVQVVGRYGRWTYASMEDALVDGREAAAALVKEGTHAR